MLLAGVCLASAAVTGAAAQIGSDRYAAIVTEARSGSVLIAASPDEQRYPASLTKMMTVYMAFDALREGRTTLSSPVHVSAEAASMPPSRIGLVPGMALTVEEAVLALVTKSANDAAAALGEHLGGGSEQRFAQMMTLRARALGMTRTTFRNASGLPDLDQVSTARDMALLGRRLLRDFPERYGYFSTPHFVFRGRTHWNHNRLLQEYDGTDGIKTGYVNDSGFNLVASAERDGVRLIASVFGGRSGRERDRHMMALLDQGFASMGVAPRGSGGAPDAPLLLSRRPASRGLAGVLGKAQAATLRSAQGRAENARGRAVATRPATGRTARNAGRPATARMVVAGPASRAAARIEQGDTGRGVAARPAAAKGKATAGGTAPRQTVAQARRKR
jgi:D-alanyl-D-alanine carboxypeptidase